MKVAWKDVEGFENYQVSNQGEIRSKGWEQTIKGNGGTVYTRNKQPKTLKQYDNGRGYKFVCLYKNNGKQKQLLVHRIVAKHFCEGFKEGLHVNHKDGNKENNKSSNLEWVTRSENMLHAVENGLLTPTVKNLIEANKARRRKVAQYCKEGERLLQTFNSIREAEDATGVSNQSIGKACMGKYRSAGGFRWKYVD